MTRVLRTLGLAAALLLVCTLLGVGTAVATAGPGPARAGDPATTGAPAVGACYDLTWNQAARRDTGKAPSSCRARHTLVVTAVGMLPASLDYVTMDFDDRPAAFWAAVQRICPRSTTRTIGGPVVRARTLWAEYLFTPSDAEIAAGARWFSCQVGLPSRGRMLAIPAGQPRRIKGAIPQRVAECVRKVKGGYAAVPCTAPHRWRTTYSVLVRKAATYKQAGRAAVRLCSKHMPSRDWLWGWDWVSPRSFVVACSAKTRH